MVEEAPGVKPTPRQGFNRPEVWAVVISIIALVFSQLPPVLTWIPQTKLETAVDGKMGIPTILGIPSVEFTVDLKNIGNRSIELSKLSVQLKYPDPQKQPRIMRAQAYMLNSGPGGANSAATTVTLAPGQQWAQLIAFSPDASPSDNISIAALKSGIEASILRSSSNPKEADATTVQKATEFFVKQMDLQQGDYVATLSGSENGKDTVLKTIEFSLYEGQIAIVKSQPDDFKYGYGISVLPVQTKQLWVDVTKTY